jgi:hypothetical protein
MTRVYKLGQLRNKTDRQLIQLRNSELETGVDNARYALQSAGNWAHAEDHYLRAKRSFAEASVLIPLARDQGGRWEARRELLRRLLEGLSVLGSGSSPAGDKTRVLARALWEARDCPEGSPEEDWFQAERALQSYAACAGT